ncbi:hypothetical protein N665_0687s0002 [Sinapis alba]|nr:hypothetical protein N665_0687s0002 [Sinapis alba]
MLFRAYTWCIFLTMERHLGSRTSWLKRRRWSCCAPGSRDSQGRPSLSHEETGGPKTLELKADGDPVGLSADVGIVVLLEDGELVGLSADVGIVVLPDSKLTEEGQQEVGDLKEGLSDQYEEAITPHCADQPDTKDSRMIQLGIFLAEQSHDAGRS